MLGNTFVSTLSTSPPRIARAMVTMTGFDAASTGSQPVDPMNPWMVDLARKRLRT